MLQLLRGSKSGVRRAARNLWKQTINQASSGNLEKCLYSLKTLTAQLLKHDEKRIPQQEEAVSAKSQRSGSIFSGIDLRQAASILENAAEALPKVRFDGAAGLQVLDKAVTVVSGSNFIDPKVLDDEVDGLLSGEKDIQQDVKNGIRTAAEHLTSTVYDVVINFIKPVFQRIGGWCPKSCSF